MSAPQSVWPRLHSLFTRSSLWCLGGSRAFSCFFAPSIWSNGLAALVACGAVCTLGSGKLVPARFTAAGARGGVGIATKPQRRLRVRVSWNLRLARCCAAAHHPRRRADVHISHYTLRASPLLPPFRCWCCRCCSCCCCRCLADGAATSNAVSGKGQRPSCLWRSCLSDRCNLVVALHPPGDPSGAAAPSAPSPPLFFHKGRWHSATCWRLTLRAACALGCNVQTHHLFLGAGAGSPGAVFAVGSAIRAEGGSATPTASASCACVAFLTHLTARAVPQPRTNRQTHQVSSHAWPMHPLDLVPLTTTFALTTCPLLKTLRSHQTSPLTL
jgi:hypothetical protein